MRHFTALTAIIMLCLSTTLFGIRLFEPQRTPSIFALLAPHACQMPCFAGIRPGETTMTEAVNILLHHPAVDPTSIQPLCTGCISFSLHWRIPERWINAPETDNLAVDLAVESLKGQNIVGAMTFHITATVGDFITYFGQPGEITSMVVANRNIIQAFRYPAYKMIFTALAPCDAEQNILKLVGTSYQLFAPDLLDTPSGTSSWIGAYNPDLDTLVRRQSCIP